MKKIVFTLIAIVTGVPAFAETAVPDVAVCDDADKVEKMLNEKGYHHLLDMKSKDEVTHLWAGGTEMIITATKDKKLCLVGSETDVTYNPVTLEKILQIYKKSQKEL